MIAAVAEGAGVVDVRTVPDPAPGPHDVIVEVGACGICGTDLHLIDSELPYSPYPVIPGHEFYGRVVAVGADVLGLREGAEVAVDPNLPCRQCVQCHAGRTNLCENYRAVGVTMDGACATFVRAPAECCYVLPDGFDLDVAALIEPLSCAIHGFDQLPQRIGDQYLVYGAGTMGLLMAGLAARQSDRPVCVVDVNADRLALAASLGHRVAGAADEFDQPDGWHTVVDCSGAVAAIEDGLRRVRSGGTFEAFGVAPAAAQARFSPFDVYRREITIVGSMAVFNSFGRAIDLLAAKPDFGRRVISHRFGVADYAEALRTFRSGDAYKVVVAPTPPPQQANDTARLHHHTASEGQGGTT